MAEVQLKLKGRVRRIPLQVLECRASRYQTKIYALGIVVDSLRRVVYNPEGPDYQIPPVKIYEIFRGSMSIFFIRVSKVVRLSPKRTAAPFCPPTRPLVSFRTRTILSCSSKFLALAGAKFAPLFANSGTEIARVLLRVRITARSTRF